MNKFYYTLTLCSLYIFLNYDFILATTINECYKGEGIRSYKGYIVSRYDPDFRRIIYFLVDKSGDFILVKNTSVENGDAESIGLQDIS